VTAAARWLWLWGPVAANLAAIFVASSLPGLPDLPAGLSDYTGHFVAYLSLGVLLLRAVAGARWSGVTAASARTAWIWAAVYGITDEVHQVWVPNRVPSIADWLADAAGAASGVAIVLWIARRRRRRAV
jgi:VanZ family protein